MNSLMVERVFVITAIVILIDRLSRYCLDGGHEVCDFVYCVLILAVLCFGFLVLQMQTKKVDVK